MSLLLYAFHVLVMTVSGPNPETAALGHDFVSFYAAGHLAAEGQPLAAYDPATHWAAQTAALGIQCAYFAFFYPPAFLLLCLPLGFMGYYAALAVWLAAGLAAYAAALRPYLPKREDYLAALAFPAVLVAASYGQNSFFTTALLAGTFASLDRRPLLAGALLGLMIVKPHLALAVPVVLLLRKSWWTLGGACLSAASLCAVATLVFGPEIWSAYAGAAQLGREAMEKPYLEYSKFVSVFAAARVLGASVTAAYGAQAFVGMAAVAGLVWTARRCEDTQLVGGLAVLTGLLVTPFVLEYDLLMLAVPLARLYRFGQDGRLSAWEWRLIAGVYMVGYALLMKIPGLLIGPAAVVVLYAIVLRHAGEKRPVQTTDRRSDASLGHAAAV